MDGSSQGVVQGFDGETGRYTVAVEVEGQPRTVGLLCARPPSDLFFASRSLVELRVAAI